MQFMEALSSVEANENYTEKLNLFGQFVGDWEILEDRLLGEDGKWTTHAGELHWSWILDGRAVQDVWMSHDEETGRAIPEGTTVRFYDSTIDAWHSVWISPVQGVVRKFLGRKIGEEIILEEERGSRKDTRTRWIFFEITPNSFRWRAEESVDDGKNWTLKEEMRIRRQQNK